MKIIKNKNSALTTLLFAIAALFIFSCNKEEAEKIPSVDLITLSKVDTSIYNMGRYINIQGNGFDDVEEVYFNNFKAYLNPSYLTPSDIVVQIPKDFPDEITNMVTLVTKSKARYDFDFTVNVPVPVINTVAYTLSQNLITIAGTDLAKAKEVSVGGVVITNFKTSTDNKYITFNVPKGIPAGVVAVKVVCPPGTASSNFDLDKASMPAITEIPCEWVDEGKLMQLNGRNLALITSVLLNNVEVKSGFVYNADNSVLKFPMPAGITPGALVIKVKNQFDKESAPFTGKYKTSEFLFWDFDAKKHCWGAPNSHLTNVGGVSANYVLWEGKIAASWWDQNNMFCGCGDPKPSSEITSNPGNYVMKFEVNVVNSWSVGSIRFSFNDDAISSDWIPYPTGGSYKTDGWKTISIPLTKWNFGTATLTGNYRLKFFTGGAPSDAVDVKIYFDNLRIDKK